MILVLVLCTMRVASGPTADLSYIGLTLYALRGGRQTIEALSLSFLFTMLNEDVFPVASASSFGRYLVVAAASLSVFSRGAFASANRSGPLLAVTCLFGFYILSHATLLSALPVISFLKGALWLTATLTILVAWQRLPDGERDLLTKRILLLFALIMIGSCALAFSEAGYLPRTNYLRGALNHSQALAAVASIAAVWATMRAFRGPKPAWHFLMFALVGFGVVVASAARTAMIASSFSVALVFGVAVLSRARGKRAMLPGLGFRSLFVLSVAGAFLFILQYETIIEIIASFSEKGAASVSATPPGGPEEAAGGRADVLEAYQVSRGSLIAQMWANISADPWGGIGFGVASNPAKMEFTTAFGIPIGAVIEKGVTPVAVLEELGIMGLLLFVAWMISVARRSSFADPERLAVLLAIILVNLGEASLMSVGGVGLIQLILIGWISTVGVKRHRASIPRR